MPLKLGANSDITTVLNKWADDVEHKLQELQKGRNRTDLGTFTVGQITRKNTITSSTSLQNLASTLPVMAGTLSYVSDGTLSTITWSWTTLQLLLPSGETFSVAAGSNTITGVPTGTYYFYPYFSTQRRKLEWVGGTTGTPKIAFTTKSIVASQTQTLDPNIPLSVGGITAIVPAAGGGGSGSGGGSGCLRADQTVATSRGLLKAEDLKIGDVLNAPQGPTTIVALEESLQQGGVNILVAGDGTDMLHVSLTHPIAVHGTDEHVAAEDLRLSDYILSLENPLQVLALVIAPMAARYYKISCEPYHEFAIGTLNAITHNAMAEK